MGIGPLPFLSSISLCCDSYTQDYFPGYSWCVVSVPLHCLSEIYCLVHQKDMGIWK